MRRICEMARDLLNFLGYQMEYSPKNVVFITGCDSGLGFNLALLCHSLNMSVIAGCRNTNSEGAAILRNIPQSNLNANRLQIIGVDLLLQDTILEAKNFIAKFVETNENYKLTALINNAGIMCLGEFEWQTDDIFKNQIEVNILGTMRITKALLPLIRQHHGRIINVTSHCALHALPGAGPYAASKGAIRLWNDSLRIEMKKYHVKVINVIPGSLVATTNIAARLQTQAKEMSDAFTDEQRQFYGEYFEEYYKYLNVISGFKPPAELNDQKLFDKFRDALTNTQPRPLYIHEPIRYKIYHILFKICPTFIADWLTVKFCLMPAFKANHHKLS